MRYSTPAADAERQIQQQIQNASAGLCVVRGGGTEAAAAKTTCKTANTATAAS